MRSDVAASFYTRHVNRDARVFWTTLSLGSLVWVAGQAAHWMAAKDWATSCELSGAVLWLAALILWPDAHDRASTSAADRMDPWTRPSPLSPMTFALLIVPVAGILPRMLVPLGPSVGGYRDVATTLMVTLAVAMTMVRVAMEQRARHRADHRLCLLAAACEQSDDMVVIVRNRSIQYANFSFQRTFGYSLAELQAMSTRDLVDLQSIGTVDAIAQALMRGEVARASAVMRRKDGSTFIGKWSASRLSTPSDRPVYIVGVVHDCTEDLRLRDQLVRQERMSAIGQLVSGVAHELNNPLQAVLGMADVMLKEHTEPKTRDDLELMRSQADRASRIIRNLLVFVRKSATERHLVCLNEICRQTVALRQYELAQRHVTVSESYAATLPLVLGNREELQQVLWHLIANAESAMSRANAGGTLTIRTFVGGDGDLGLEVSDDGPGIPKEEARHIFEPFFTTKPVGEGPGLGLSIAFGIVTAHGGSLELVPSERGACFRVTLPGAGWAA